MDSPDSKREKVNALRQRTGAGILDCAKALAVACDNLEAAADALIQAGHNKPVITTGAMMSGLVHTYTHQDRVAVAVEVNCVTDFAARTDTFRQFVHDLAMHIAAFAPSCVDSDPRAEVWAKNDPAIRDVLLAKCLMIQPWIHDPTLTVAAKLCGVSATLREPVIVSRFARFELGKAELDQG